MIVYCFCPLEEVTERLEKGFPRECGRQFVFTDWDDIQIIFSGLVRKTNSTTLSNYAVLVLDVDEDMLISSAIPSSRLPTSLREEDQRKLQSRSYYIEVDLSVKRIIDVKNGLGDSIYRQYESRGKQRAPIIRFLSYVKPYYRYVLGATIAGLIKFLVPLAFPWMLRVMLDDVVLKTDLSVAERIQQIGQLIVVMLVINVIWLFACYYRSVLGAVAGHRMIRDMRVALFDHVQRLSHAFFSRQQSGAIVSRVINDLSLAQNFVGSALTNVWMDSALIVALLVILFSIHPILAFISVALMPIYIVSLRAIGSRIRQSTLEVQQRLEILSGGLQEKVAGVGVVKGFTHEPQEVLAFTSQANKLLKRVMSTVRFTALNETLVGFVVHTSPVLVVGYGVHQILDNKLTVGQLTQFLLYLAMFYFPLQRLSDLSVVLANAVAAIGRIFEYFDMQPHVQERPDANEITTCRGSISFEDVSFCYDSNVMVLKNINLTIREGETVAFVGPSGSGKSTLVNLIPRFYDPTSGIIRLDGNDLRDLKLASLRKQIGIVNQETILFSGTIYENLLLAKPEATLEKIVAALEAANAMEFIEQLPDGLWTEIGERGTTLSGGQKQCLAIARAFLKDPRILILDEATSALDSKAEHRIQDALARLLKDRTSVIIAHRLSTIINANRIVVLEHGRIVEVGNHRELLERGGAYSMLYNEQFYHVKTTA